MLLQILNRTPPWVFALFMALLLFGALRILGSRAKEAGAGIGAFMPGRFLNQLLF